MAEKSFEQILKELEEVVKALENKEIALDDAVKKYKLGLELTTKAHQMLKDAESVLVKEED